MAAYWGVLLQLGPSILPHISQFVKFIPENSHKRESKGKRGNSHLWEYLGQFWTNLVPYVILGKITYDCFPFLPENPEGSPNSPDNSGPRIVLLVHGYSILAHVSWFVKLCLGSSHKKEKLGAIVDCSGIG